MEPRQPEKLTRFLSQHKSNNQESTRLVYSRIRRASSVGENSAYERSLEGEKKQTCFDEKHRRYFAGINKVGKNLSRAITSPCIVCGGEHSFDHCSVLANNAFLRDHYIKFSSFIKRELNDRQTKTGSLPPTLTPAVIHALNASAETLVNDDKEADFQEGRD